MKNANGSLARKFCAQQLENGSAILVAFALLTASNLVAPELSTADIVTDFTATADGRTRTFGEDTVETMAARLSVAQSGGLVDNVILEFDISAIGAANTLSAASLVLVHDGFLSNIGQTPVPLETFVYAGDGVVDIDDFDAAGVNAGNFSVPLDSVSDGDQLVFDFTDLTEFQSIIDAGTGLVTVRLETNSFATIQFASLENTSFAAPVLRLESVPEPSSAGFAMLVSGLLVCRRRSRGNIG